MTKLAPTLQAFFTTNLTTQYGASPHTIAAYRDTWSLLLRYVAATTGTPPQTLDFADLTADVIGAFLAHLESDRHSSVTTRNARLAALHSLFTYAAYRHPEHAATISRVLAIPSKRHQRTDLTYLTATEVAALLAAPDLTTPAGRRDHALLQTAIITGMRVSELTGLTVTDVHLGTGAHALCRGKGRKNRTTPLDRETVATLRPLIAGRATGFVFPTRTGTRMSRDAVAARLAKHTATAADTCLSLTNKNVTPHVLRHTAAMRLLHAGVDITVIALWLGHESINTTQIYLHADMTTKQTALARTTPTGTRPGRYRPPNDDLLAFLQAL
jgi:site-specific recombinase XerD